MMTIATTRERPTNPPRNDIEDLIARHGGFRVMRALAAALLRPNRAPPRPPDVRHLSDHLRRDVGLPTEAAPRLAWHSRP